VKCSDRPLHKVFVSARGILIAISMPLVSGYGQTVLHSGENIFVISVQGGNGVAFRGSCLATSIAGESKNTKLEGVAPAEFRVVGTDVYLTLQSLTGGKEPEIRIGTDGKRVLDQVSPNAQAGPYLDVTISKNGATLKSQRTDAPHGVITLSTTPPASGAAIRTELEVEGSVRYAVLTFTSETGDIEQQLVPVPFNKVFYPREGWIVGLSAQKARVTRIDPLGLHGAIEVLDDGRSGSMRVAIKVNGASRGSDETSEPFGIAKATIRVQ
jgi:hypothetical protein